MLKKILESSDDKLIGDVAKKLVAIANKEEYWGNLVGNKALVIMEHCVKNAYYDAFDMKSFKNEIIYEFTHDDNVKKAGERIGKDVADLAEYLAFRKDQIFKAAYDLI